MIASLALLVGCTGSLPSEPNDNVGGAAPVYQGMVLSDSVQALSAFSQGSISNLSLFTNLSTTYTENDLKDIIANEMPYENTGEIDHFADLNQDVFITVKLLNPDGQAILRFTLNGVVYQSFQFNEGSDSENLILKVNSGTVSGVKEFTIDEIKYVENGTNEIKDAIFDGDRTIKLGVKHGTLPTAQANNLVHNATSMSVNANVNDSSALIAEAGDTLKAFLITNNEVLDSTDLVLGDNTIEFSKLSPNTQYVFVIATIIDVLDGNGKHIYLLLDAQSFTTGTLASIDNVVPTQDSVAFDITATDTDEVGAITAIELYQGETLIKALTDLRLRTFSDLLSNNEYQIKVTYTYDLNDGLGEQELITTETVTTLTKATPEVVVENIAPTQDSVTFDITVTDLDEVGAITAIELYQGETLIEALTDLSLRTFSDLLSNNEYQIKVTYTYDLNDGLGEQELIITETVTTLAKATPKVLVEYVVPTQDSVTFDITVTDADEVGEITAIELYQGETLIEALTDLTLREFKGLSRNTTYQIKVTYTYDLNDGKFFNEIAIYYSMITQLLNGEGTEENPYLISTVEDLDTLRIISIGHFSLVNDMDLGNTSWLPIPSFNGTFNGNGFSIINLTITEISNSNIGLFAINYGSIKNVRLTNISYDIDNFYNSSFSIGSLVGTNHGSIDGVYISGEMVVSTLRRSSIGGLVGYNGTSGTISNIHSITNILTSVADVENSASDTGGLIGYNFGSLENSYSSGDINSIGGNVKAGGLIGYNQFGIVKNSFSSGSTTSGSAIGAQWDGIHINVYTLKDGEIFPVGVNSNNTVVFTEDITEEWFINVLGWSYENWDFSQINPSENKFAKLKFNG